MKRIYLTIAAGAFGFAVPGCAENAGPDGPTGTLRAALEMSTDRHDVTHVRFDVVRADQACSAEPIQTEIVALELEGLPPRLDTDGAAGSNHAFSDSLFVLDPGSYRVCATPLKADGQPSEECNRTDSFFDVFAEVTIEQAMISQCKGNPTGGLDAIVALNSPPRIEDLFIEPSKFVSTCEEVGLSAEASDPNNDPLLFSWSLEGQPPGSNAQLVQLGERAILRTDTEGDYLVLLTVSDPHGGTTSLSVPIHVTQEPWEYTVSHSGGSFPAAPLRRPMDVASFYSYGSPDAFSANTGLELEDRSLVFLYQDDTTGQYSLVIIHDVAHDSEGGQVRIKVTGLDNATGVVVTDDAGDNYNMATGIFQWNWAPCCTDGMAINYEDRYVCTTIETKKAKGVAGWTYLSEAPDGELRYEELGSGPFTICHCLAEAAPLEPQDD